MIFYDFFIACILHAATFLARVVLAKRGKFHLNMHIFKISRKELIKKQKLCKLANDFDLDH